MTRAHPWATRVAELAGEIERLRPRTEREGEVPAELVRQLAAAGFFRLLLPRELGGHEADPVTVLETVRHTARHDASVAWLLMASMNSALLAARMDPEGAAEVFGDPLSVVAGSLHRGGTARRDGDGYRLSGRWRLASGCAAARWLICGAAVDGEPSDRPATLLVERAAATVVRSWDAVGLRGSGTDDFEVGDAWVPARRMLPPGARSRIDRPLYRSAMAHFINPPLAAVALGIADDALPAFAATAAVKTSRGTKETISRLATVQDTYGRALALRDAAADHLYATMRRTWDQAQQPGELPHDATAAVMLATASAMQHCVEAVTRLYTAAGSVSILESSRLARCFRDVHVAAHHDAASEAVFARVGDFRLNGRG